VIAYYDSAFSAAITAAAIVGSLGGRALGMLLVAAARAAAVQVAGWRAARRLEELSRLVPEWPPRPVLERLVAGGAQ
jgi:hypothetical protein